jgi:soluble lytic murein transglycosylase-like protein
MKAIAWQESGWQSTILACDGGVGTMQVMPDTAAWLNDRFGPNYDVNTLSGNAALGAEYLQWEIVYFGAFYFGTFDLDATAPVGPDGADLRLRDVVIAGYNVGAAALENRADSGDYLDIPNQRYVDNVIALTTDCECLAY